MEIINKINSIQSEIEKMIELQNEMTKIIEIQIEEDYLEGKIDFYKKVYGGIIRHITLNYIKKYELKCEKWTNIISEAVKRVFKIQFEDKFKLLKDITLQYSSDQKYIQRDGAIRKCWQDEIREKFNSHFSDHEYGVATAIMVLSDELSVNEWGNYQE